MTHTVTVEEANSQFAELLAHVVSEDDEIIIAREGKPIARLVPIPEKPMPRVPGTAIGQITLLPGFDEPMSDLW